MSHGIRADAICKDEGRDSPTRVATILRSVSQTFLGSSTVPTTLTAFPTGSTALSLCLSALSSSAANFRSAWS